VKNNDRFPSATPAAGSAMMTGTFLAGVAAFMSAPVAAQDWSIGLAITQQFVETCGKITADPGAAPDIARIHGGDQTASRDGSMKNGSFPLDGLTSEQMTFVAVNWGVERHPGGTMAWCSMTLRLVEGTPRLRLHEALATHVERLLGKDALRLGGLVTVDNPDKDPVQVAQMRMATFTDAAFPPGHSLRVIEGEGFATLTESRIRPDEN